MASKRTLPLYDKRIELRDTKTAGVMPKYRTKAEWEARAAELRMRVLVSCGLWPMPERCALKAHVFDRVELGGYSIEKVYFQSLPDFYVCGNLYRPLDRKGPFPAILNPHGHWQTGRLGETEAGSVRGRCIGLARRGYAAFSWSMVGKNEATQLPHDFGADADRNTSRALQLWGLSLMGLQTWDSIRAIDFVTSLPDVDAKRIGVTGASGGGTQTYMITAADERIRFAAPAVMVSQVYQGGCLCENAPLLRLDSVCNVELAALAAPRPMLLLACTGDWTQNTPWLEYPAVRSIYRLYSATDRLDYVCVDSGHNYNQESREACYSFFDKWIMGKAATKETPFQIERDEDLLCWPVGKPPKRAVDAEGLTRVWIKNAEAQAAAALGDRERLRRDLEPCLRRALAVDVPDAKDIVSAKTADGVRMGRAGVGDRVELRLYRPDGKKHPRQAVLVVCPKGDQQGAGLAEAFADRGMLAALCHGFTWWRQARSEYFTTYNRTDVQLHVQDILTSLVYLDSQPGIAKTHVVGDGAAGLWALLARSFAPVAGRTVADAAKFDLSDQAFASRLFAPAIRRAGDLRTAVALMGRSPLLIHNAGVARRWAGTASRKRLTPNEIIDWICQ